MTDVQTTRPVNPPTATEFLYRLRDANGALLYVGITSNWPARMKQHQVDKPWWSDVLAVELVRLSCSRAQVEAIEKAVIKAEAPIYNVTHNGALRRVVAARVEDVYADWPEWSVGDAVQPTNTRCRYAGIGQVVSRVDAHAYLVGFDDIGESWHMAGCELTAPMRLAAE